MPEPMERSYERGILFTGRGTGSIGSGAKSVRNSFGMGVKVWLLFQKSMYSSRGIMSEFGCSIGSGIGGIMGGQNVVGIGAVPPYSVVN